MPDEILHAKKHPLTITSVTLSIIIGVFLAVMCAFTFVYLQSGYTNELSPTFRYVNSSSQDVKISFVTYNENDSTPTLRVSNAFKPIYFFQRPFGKSLQIARGKELAGQFSTSDLRRFVVIQYQDGAIKTFSDDYEPGNTSIVDAQDSFNIIYTIPEPSALLELPDSIKNVINEPVVLTEQIMQSLVEQHIILK